VAPLGRMICGAMRAFPDLENAVAAVPPGAWAIAVSGGADSVALLHLLLAHRPDLSLHVVHLDHETRAGQSALDAEFVRQLAASHGLPCTIARRSEVESGMADLPRNLSARFRSARFALLGRVVAERGLAGALLAHHGDDQAETVLQRLLRGSGPAGLAGMSRKAVIGGITIVRPLLQVRQRRLREFLVDRGIAWREDASNESMLQQRNRVRAMLRGRDELVEAAREVGESCARLSAWLREQGGADWGEALDVAAVRKLPPPVAREAARQWLAGRAGLAGCARRAEVAGRAGRAGRPVEITPAAAERLVAMATDAATPARQHFPGGVLVRRRGGKLFTDESPAKSSP
jgi:tRNA(Ile)-lysidine synthetase-like protein